MGYNIGIHMNQKEPTKTFMMISKLKNLLVSMAYTNVFQRFKSWIKLRPLPISSAGGDWWSVKSMCIGWHCPLWVSIIKFRFTHVQCVDPRFENGILHLNIVCLITEFATKKYVYHKREDVELY